MKLCLVCGRHGVALPSGGATFGACVLANERISTPARRRCKAPLCGDARSGVPLKRTRHYATHSRSIVFAPQRMECGLERRARAVAQFIPARHATFARMHTTRWWVLVATDPTRKLTHTSPPRASLSRVYALVTCTHACARVMRLFVTEHMRFAMRKAPSCGSYEFYSANS